MVALGNNNAFQKYNQHLVVVGNSRHSVHLRFEFGNVLLSVTEWTIHLPFVDLPCWSCGYCWSLLPSERPCHSLGLESRVQDRWLQSSKRDSVPRSSSSGRRMTTGVVPFLSSAPHSRSPTPAAVLPAWRTKTVEIGSSLPIR